MAVDPFPGFLRILLDMRSVADEIREKQREEERKLSAEERLERAFALGEADLEAYRRAHGLTRQEARRQLQRRRQLERPHPSKCMLEIIG